MIVAFSAPTYDPAGCVVIDADPGQSEILSAERRVSRTATLDGGCVITDSGFSHADRTFSITAQLDDKSMQDALQRLHRTYSLLIVATPDGVYRGAIERLRVTKGSMVTLRVLVKEKISE